MRKPLLKALCLICLIFTVLTACDNNVYLGEPEKVAPSLWKVNNEYFDSLQEAMDYIYGTTKGITKSKSITDIPLSRTAILQRDVLHSNGETGGGLIVPEDFEGQLVIDFNTFTYEFDNSLDHFFDVRGGDEVYIYNGTTVIYNEADHKPYALAVNSDTVTIDDHLIDDRRVEDENHSEGAKLFDVGTKGSLVITNTSSSETGATLTGIISIATDGVAKGGKIQVTNSNLVITNIFTTYQDSDGNIHPNIPDVKVLDGAKSVIDILSGNIEILNINQGTDYKEGDTLYKKAVLNIIKGDPEDPSRDTVVNNPHNIDTIIEAIVDNVTDPDQKAEKVIIHDLYDDWSTDDPGYPATCTENGLEVRWCHSAICDIDGSGTHYHEEKVVPALGHLITSGWVTTDPVTHWHECDRCGAKVGEEAHSFSEWTYDPVSEQSVRDCFVCGRHETETHIHTLTHVPRVPHTATTTGNIEYWYCTVCNKKYKDAAGTIQVTDVTDPHVLEHHEAVPHTCTTDGNYEYWHCTVCELNFSDEEATTVITKIIDYAAHDGIVHHAYKAETCTEDGNIEYWACSVCNKNFKTKTYDSEKDMYVYSDEVSDADTVRPKKGHKYSTVWSVNDEKHWHVCLNGCGSVIDEAVHSWNDWHYDTEKQKTVRDCTICSYTQEEGHTHTFKEWYTEDADKHYKVCVCGAHYDGENHSFTDWAYDSEHDDDERTCSVCSREETRAHVHASPLTVIPAKAATCTEKGNHQYWKCPLCNRYYSDEGGNSQTTPSAQEIEALGHNAERTEAKAATCTEAGNIEYWHCLREGCGKYFSDSACTNEISQADTVIDPLGHIWSEDWTYNDEIDEDHHWHECTRCHVINEESIEDHVFEIVFDADISARKLSIESYCITCKKRYVNVIPSATGAFDISVSIGIDVVRTTPGVNEWTISVKDSVKEANKNNTCTWYSQSGVELSGLYGTDPITVSISDEVAPGDYKIWCNFTDWGDNLKDSCFLQISK